MKKLLLVSLFFTTLFSYAQEKNDKFTIKKGSWNYEGQFSLNFYNSSTKSNNGQIVTNNSFGSNFKLQVGNAIQDNLVLGLGIESIGNTIYSSKAINSELGVGYYTYFKKYFPINKRLSFHLQGELRYANIKEGIKSEGIFNTQNRLNRYSIGLRPGITYFLSKNIALQANLGFIGYTRNDYTSIEKTSNSFDFDFSPLNFSFGILFNF